MPVASTPPGRILDPNEALPVIVLQPMIASHLPAGLGAARPCRPAEPLPVVSGSSTVPRPAASGNHCYDTLRCAADR